MKNDRLIANRMSNRYFLIDTATGEFSRMNHDGKALIFSFGQLTTARRHAGRHSKNLNRSVVVYDRITQTESK